jgi:hypothetical protein
MYIVVRMCLPFVWPTQHIHACYPPYKKHYQHLYVILLFPVRHNRVLNKEVHNNVTCRTVTFWPHTQLQGVFSSPIRATGAQLLLDILCIHLNTTRRFFPSAVSAVRLLPDSAAQKYGSKWIYQSLISISFCISISEPWIIYFISMMRLFFMREMITDYQTDSVNTTISLWAGIAQSV